MILKDKIINNDETFDGLVEKLNDTYTKLDIVRELKEDYLSDGMFYNLASIVFDIHLKRDMKTNVYRYVGPHSTELNVSVLPMGDINFDRTYSIDEITTLAKNGKILINTMYYLYTDKNVFNNKNVIEENKRSEAQIANHLSSKEDIYNEEAKLVRKIYDKSMLNFKEKELLYDIKSILMEIEFYSNNKKTLGLVK